MNPEIGDALWFVMHNLDGWAKKAYAVPRLEGGNGVDIVIRIDGTYYGSSRDNAAMVDFWNETISKARAEMRKRGLFRD